MQPAANILAVETKINEKYRNRLDIESYNFTKLETIIIAI